MKKIFTLLTFLLLCGCLYLAYNSLLNTTTAAVSANDLAVDVKAETETKAKVRGIARAMRYLHKKRANQVTGEINAKDVLKAREMANANSALQKAAEIDWEYMGPNDVGGRTRALVIDKDNPQKLITGGVAGGIFTSTNSGLKWADHPQNPELDNLAVSTITQAANGDIYIGTGEAVNTYQSPSLSASGNFNSADLLGSGVYKSTDGGVSYTRLESTIPTFNNASDEWAVVNRLQAHPTNANIVYAVNHGGVFMTEDGGQTWKTPNGIASGTRPGYDVKVTPNGTVHILVSNKYYRSTDGQSFENLTGDTPGKFPEVSGRKILATSVNHDTHVYATTITSTFCLREVLRSTDSGTTWEVIGKGGSISFQPLSNGAQCQGWYDLALGVSSSNPDKIFLGGISLWSWELNKGWKQVDQWRDDAPSNAYYVHADKHDIIFDKNDGDRMFVVSDGGVAVSHNATTSDSPTFQTINKNYNITQFYSVAATLDGRVVGGTQDNGTQFINISGSSRLAALEVRGGDGGYMEVSKLQSNGMFAANPEGVLFRSSNGGTSFSNYFDEWIDCEPVQDGGGCNSDGAMDGNPDFVTPFLLWEDYNYLPIPVPGQAPIEVPIPDGVVAARMFTGNNNGQVWMTEEPLVFSKIPSWYHGAENQESVNPPGIGFIGESTRGGITALATTLDGNTVFAGTDAGSILRISNINGGNPIDYQVKEFVIEGEGGRYVSSVTVDPAIPTNIVVALGNYGNDTYVYTSNNALSGNVTFEPIQGEGDSALPPMPIYSIIIDKTNSNRFIAGTDLGVWSCEKVQTGATSFEYFWTEENAKLGRTPVFAVRQEVMNQNGCDVLYIGTHGRGIYRSTSFTFPFCDTTLPVYDAGDVTSTEDVTNLSAGIKVYPNPIQQQATVNIHLQENADIKLSIYNLQGQLVRTNNLGYRTKGEYNETIYRNDLPAGNYFIALENGQKQAAIYKVMFQ